MSSYSFQGCSRFWNPRNEEENRAIFSAQKRQNVGIKSINSTEIRPIYLTANRGEPDVEKKWSVKQLIRLLRLYGAHRCLWDVRDADNRNRKLRRAALIDITAAMGEGLTYAQVVQKINVLRATYRYEKRRIKQRIRRGIGAKTKLKWFALADVFLRNIPRTEKFRRNEDSAGSDSDLEDAVVFSIDPESLLPLNDDEFDFEVEAEKISQTPADSDCEMNEANTFPNEYKKVRINEQVRLERQPTLAASEIKVESEKYTEESAKRSWTQSESLEFVHHLKAYPILWTAQSNIDKKAQWEAIEDIANKMLLPLQRVAKRVNTFKRIYAREKLKISQNNNYQPNIMWWKFAEELTTCAYDIVEIKQEILDDEMEWENAETPLNPIASVAPASVTVEDAIEQLFDVQSNEQNAYNENADANDYYASNGKTSENNNENSEDSVSEDVSTCLRNNAKTSNVAATKLVWNGLEDDLLEGKWSLKHSVKFLRLYGAHRCLWDLNEVDFRSRELRNAAIEDIAAAMGFGLNADYVAKKIRIFRITYMQQRKRMLAALKAGKEPEIQLRWFPLADSFLRAHIGLRSIKEHEFEMPQFDFQYVYANLNLIDPALLTDFRGKGTQNTIDIGNANELPQQKVIQKQSSDVVSEVND